MSTNYTDSIKKEFAIQNVEKIIIEQMKSCVASLTDEQCILLYRKSVSLFQKKHGNNGKKFEKIISKILRENNIVHKEQVPIDNDGTIVKKTDKDKIKHIVDIIIGNPNVGDKITQFRVISVKLSCRERWAQDDYLLQTPPKCFFLVVFSDDYPKPTSFGASNKRRIVFVNKKNDILHDYLHSVEEMIELLKPPLMIQTKEKPLEFTFADLFCGIGSFHHSLVKLSGNAASRDCEAIELCDADLTAKCVFACDISESAKATYKKNYGIEPLDDIVDIEPRNVPDFDILCGGFPCQPFSNIGKHRGLDDLRGGLFYQISKFILEKHPKAIILENVRGLLRDNDGDTFKSMMTSLTNMNYEMFHTVLDCSDFGIPQMRKRLFMVGIRKDLIYTPFSLNNFQKLPCPKLSAFLANGKKLEKEMAYTIRCGGRKSPINDKHNWDGYFETNHDEYRLTIDDCKQLQGFPRNFELMGSETEKYKLLGNTIPTNLTYIVCKYVVDYLQNK